MTLDWSRLNYVKWIQENKITIFCEIEEKEEILKLLGAKRKLFDRKVWILRCNDENDLAKKLQMLNENKFMFAGGSSGWNPVDIFILMRERKLVFGSVIEVVWTGYDQILTRIL